MSICALKDRLCGLVPSDLRLHVLHTQMNVGELALMVGEDACQTRQMQMYCEGLQGMPVRVSCQKECQNPPSGELQQFQPDERNEFVVEAANQCCGRKVASSAESLRVHGSFPNMYFEDLEKAFDRVPREVL